MARKANIRVTDLETGVVYQTASDAEKALGFRKCAISNCSRWVKSRECTDRAEVVVKGRRLLMERTETAHSSIKVRCIETGKIYNSINEAGLDVWISPCCISLTLKGATKTAGGYHWEYA